jgi:hypothetical protein
VATAAAAVAVAAAAVAAAAAAMVVVVAVMVVVVVVAVVVVVVALVAVAVAVGGGGGGGGGGGDGGLEHSRRTFAVHFRREAVERAVELNDVRAFAVDLLARHLVGSSDAQRGGSCLVTTTTSTTVSTATSSSSSAAATATALRLRSDMHHLAAEAAHILNRLLQVLQPYQACGDPHMAWPHFEGLPSSRRHKRGGECGRGGKGQGD